MDFCPSQHIVIFKTYLPIVYYYSKNFGRGSQVVNMLAFYPGNISSNPLISTFFIACKEWK